MASITSLAACPRSAHDVFLDEVAPVLESRCSATVCHGVAPDAEAMGEVINWSRLFLRVDGGRLVDLRAAEETAQRFVNPTEDPAFSSLLRKPLAREYGGLPHIGRDDFLTPDSPGYQSIHRWISRLTDGGEVPEPLEPLEQHFADSVQPALASASCLNANCHGPSAAVPFRLDPGIRGVFSVAASRANYEASVTMLALGEDVSLSRLLRKGLPLHAGGIVHKGGNQGFFLGPDDPRVLAIETWACAERLERLGESCTTRSLDFVFVRGPIAPGDLFDLDRFAPGGDIWLATVDEASMTVSGVENLTASLHALPADVRDPAIDHTGTRLVFAMRTSADTGHDLWVLDLATREGRRLTDDAGPLPGGGLRTHRDPTWGPDGHVWFVSTRAGVVADGGRFLDADLYELDPADGALTRRTFTPHVERKPQFLVVGEENGGEISFTVLRDVIGGQAVGHPFRFPPDLATEYHQHFGVTPIETLFHDLRELPDGRYVLTVGELDWVWGAGRLAVLDRNFGPELNREALSPRPGIPFYSEPLVRLDPAAATAQSAGSLYRDPAPLGNGQILVAHAAGPVDPTDPAAVFDFGIELLTLAESVDGSGPRIVGRTVLIDEPGVHDFDPEPIAPRLPAPLAAQQRWDPAADTGVLVHHGLPIIDALLSNLQPSAPKVVRDDFRYVRLVEAVDATPMQRRPIPAAETMGGVTGATTISLGVHPPTRILAELPLAIDGSFHLEVPAGVPFRLQGLDEYRVAVGTMHNRWFYLAPGQRMLQGVSNRHLGVYSARCAICHGALDGEPDHVLQPDAVTSASLTVSRYIDGNPRAPLDPIPVGDGTRMEVDFAQQVRPILDRACVTAGCHAGATPAAGLGLDATLTTHFDLGYENLLVDGVGSGSGKRWVDEPGASAWRSSLVEWITGREMGAPAVLANPGVAHPAEIAGHEALDQEDQRTFIRWVDLGAIYRGVTP